MYSSTVHISRKPWNRAFESEKYPYKLIRYVFKMYIHVPSVPMNCNNM